MLGRVLWGISLGGVGKVFFVVFRTRLWGRRVISGFLFLSYLGFYRRSLFLFFRDRVAFVFVFILRGFVVYVCRVSDVFVKI